MRIEIRSVALCLMVATCLIPRSSDADTAAGPATIDDLVKRSHIAQAVLSPDGRYAAYLVLAGDPIGDQYNVTVRVVDSLAAGHPIIVGNYALRPGDAISAVGVLLPGAGDLQWISTDVLIFVVKEKGKTNVLAWDAETMRTRLVLAGHDRVSFDLRDVSYSRFDSERVRVTVTDLEPPTVQGVNPIRDKSWRMRDAYRFFGAFKNPKMGSWASTQNWVLNQEGSKIVARGVSEPFADWDHRPKEDKLPDQVQPLPQGGAADRPKEQKPKVFDIFRSLAPSGKTEAIVEFRESGAEGAEAHLGAYDVALREGSNREILIPAHASATRLLGWSPDSRKLFYLDNEAQQSTVYSVDRAGKRNLVLRSAFGLAKPGDFFARDNHQIVSEDGHCALLVRSSNLTPDELVKINLQSGAMTVLDAPNASFADKVQPQVRFYSIESTHGVAWGRLYLPVHYSPGTRYPLVITHYHSNAGFGTSTGDEVPIIPLTSVGIAVFAMESAGFNSTGRNGDGRAEIDRLQRPLDAMEWIVRRLSEEGIINPDRVGLSGVSYGAEIAMYAYWKSHTFRAVSTSSGSLDPVDHLFGGLTYSASLDSRGLGRADETWPKIAAGLNARADLPPLLIQSGDQEEASDVPNWSELRLAGAAVEWREYPSEGHEKWSPANKWWVYERNLDWFRFWLQGYEEPAPEKAEQYRRWERLCDLQIAEKTGQPTFSAPTKH